jgi:acetoin utilization protein AcuB
MLVSGRMTREVVTASPATSLADGLALMHERRIRHLPVLEGGRLVGIVSDRDLRGAAPPVGALPEEERLRFLRERRIAEIMKREVVTVEPGTPVEEAARVMASRRIGALPVLEGDDVVGILTASDLLRGFVDLFGMNRPSSRIEVRIPNRPGELARVVRLIGVEHKINIAGMVVPAVSPGVSVAVIRIQTLDPRPVVEGLRGLGYDVGWPALDLPDGGEVPEPSIRRAEGME